MRAAKLAVSLALPLLAARAMGAADDLWLSEIMANAPAPEDELEFVELVNLGDDTLGLGGWTLWDGSHERVFPEFARIFPHSYLVVARDSTAFRDFADYEGTETTLVLEMAMSLANGADSVALRESEGGRLRSVFGWAEDSGDTRSWEKIDPRAGDGNDNWGISAPFGSPGRWNSASPYHVDLGLDPETVAWLPLLPRLGDAVEVGATVHNLGLTTVSGARLEMAADGAEPFADLELVGLAPRDSVVTRATWRPLWAGSHSLQLRLVVDGDEDPDNNTAQITVEVQEEARESRIVLSEVMANAPSPENALEFVELHNLDPWEGDLSAWTLSEGSVERTLPAGERIGGGAYLVLSPDTTAFRAFAEYGGEAELLEWPMALANAGDSLTLRDALGQIRGLFAWTTDAGEARSWEKITAGGGDAGQNWAESAVFGSPGVRNTVSRLAIDLALEQLLVEPARVAPGDSPRLLARVSNQGEESSPPASLQYMLDGMEFDRQSIAELAPGAVDTLETILQSLAAGQYTLAAAVDLPGDENEDNNHFSLVLEVRGLGVVISEVMANPAGAEGALPGGLGDEYVELCNLGEQDVDLAGWAIADGDGVDEIVAWHVDSLGLPGRGELIIGSTLLAPGGWALILDRDYADPTRAELPYSLAPGALVLTVRGSDLGGSGLSTADPLTLFRRSGRGRADVADTYGTPLDEEEAKDRDDDGADAIPFDPGDGRAVERVDLWGADRETNWQLSVRGGTPGRHNSVSPFALDVALTKLHLTPEAPTPGDFVELHVVVRNLATESMQNIKVRAWSLGAGVDSVAVGMDSVAVLAPGQEETVSFVWGPVPDSSLLLAARLSAQGDQNPSNDSAQRRFGHSIVINEVLANPAGNENEIPGGQADEWVELYNASTTAIDLAGWMLSDGDGVDTLVIWAHGPLRDPDPILGETLLGARGFAVVLDADYTVRGATQPYDFAPGALVVGVHDGDLASAGLSTTEPLTLYPPGLTLAHSVASTFGLPKEADDPFERDAASPTFPYDAGEGRSWERLSPDRADGPGGWVPALAGSSPGAVNSVAPVGADLAVESLIATDDGSAGELQLRAIVAAAGTLSVSGAQLCWFEDSDLDDHVGAADRELAAPTALSVVGRGQRLEISTHATLETGRHRIFAQLSADERPANNRFALDLRVGEVPPTLVINEFLCRPDESRQQSEWIELHNPSPARIDLRGWKIGDESDQDWIVEPADAAVLIAPGAFLILTQDAAKFRAAWPLVQAPALEPSRWESLNNGKDTVVLVDPDRFHVERVPYDESWRGRRSMEDGISWERVAPGGDADDPDNWWLSVAGTGSTPGRLNSLAAGFSAEISLQISPDPFSPDGNGFQDQTAIRYHLPPKSLLTMRIFDARGRPVRTLVDGAGRSDGVALWDGRDDRGGLAPVGLYVVLAEALANQLRSAKATVVLARPLR